MVGPGSAAAEPHDGAPEPEAAAQSMPPAKKTCSRPRNRQDGGNNSGRKSCKKPTKNYPRKWHPGNKPRRKSKKTKKVPSPILALRRQDRTELANSWRDVYDSNSKRVQGDEAARTIGGRRVGSSCTV